MAERVAVDMRNQIASCYVDGARRGPKSSSNNRSRVLKTASECKDFLSTLSVKTNIFRHRHRSGGAGQLVDNELPELISIFFSNKAKHDIQKYARGTGTQGLYS